MRWLIGSSRLSLAVVVVLVGLLVVLATLQYNWIAQLSEAERVRLQDGLDQSTDDFCNDFDREIALALEVFNVGRPADDEALVSLLNDRLAEWRLVATWPEMVRELIVIRSHETEGLSLFCFNEEKRTLVGCEWTDELARIRRSLGGPGPGVRVIDGVLPGLVLAIQNPPAPTAESPLEWRPPHNHLVIRLDLGVIADTVLPRLAEDHFGLDGGLPYLLTVSSDGPVGQTIFQTDVPSRSRSVDPDATGRLFGMRSSAEPSASPRPNPRLRRPPPRGQGPAGGPEHPPQMPPPPGMHGRIEEGRWILAVRHPDGSLEDVVVRARRRNMAISAAMLIMLGFTAVLMVASTRRARQLARQQMDFVAAVSHELRTPLTAIRSAGQNLADGIVEDPEKVQSYGTLIEREGRRLTEMIGRVLTFAGIRSGRQIYRMEPVDIGDIVRAALEDGSWVLEDSGFVVETEIADHLPRVHGDAVALRQVVTNLIDNALKYAADGRWLDVQVSVESGSRGDEVRISVADHGPGIPRRELATIFEPFHRGADSDSSIPGSGLGLAMVRSIVKAHGGDIEVASSSPGGAVFTVRLPAVREQVTERGKQK